MMHKNNDGTVTIEGRITEVRDGSSKINRTYTYGYRSLRVLVGHDYYSVLVASSKFNKFGFLPKVGHWIRVIGRLSLPKDDLYNPSIKYVSHFEHIENPNKGARKIKP